MPTWGELLEELNERSVGGVIPYKIVLDEYMQKLYKKTNRNTIFYATAWTNPKKAKTDPQNLHIGIEDVQGLMYTIHGLKGNDLDLILYSPGGSVEAAEAIVNYLRKKFSHIRVIIPNAAMSAATMLACASDRIVMGKHSFIGPIDPQMLILTQNGPKSIAAQSIQEEFKLAKKQIQNDEKSLNLWMLIIKQYSPALLTECEHALKLSKELVERWLNDYMFSNMEGKEEKAKNIAEKLSNKDFHTHGRYLGIDYAKKIGLLVDELEDDQNLQDLVLSVFHVMMHTFGGTGAVKIIVNHLGAAFVINQTSN